MYKKPIENDEIVSLYKRGLSSDGIGKQLGVSGVTVRNRLRDAGVARRSRGIARLSREELDEIVRLYVKQEMPSTELGRRFGIAHDTVRAYLRGLGIAVRGLGDALCLAWKSRRHASPQGQPPGSRRLTSSGYVLVKVPDYFGPNNDGWVQEHVYVWECAHGPPSPGYHVHHKNGDKQDNRLENLVALSPSEHRRFHEAERRGSADSSPTILLPTSRS